MVSTTHSTWTESYMDRISSYSNARSAFLLFTPIFIGMATAQAIATLFVHLSSNRIFMASSAIKDAGLIPIPTGAVMTTLKNFGVAFWGGLFFTLSIGIGLALVTWAIFRLWDFLFKRHPAVLMCYGILWVALLIYVNTNGVTLFPTLFCLLVPLTTAVATVQGFRSRPPIKSLLWLTPVITLIALTALWSTQLNSHLFTTIRDHVLLSNPLGRAVNDFYYQYTLYAAEAFKPFDQKTVRTGHVVGVTDERQLRRLRNLLARHDVLILEEIDRPDVIFQFFNTDMVLRSIENGTIETSIQKFLSAPQPWLRKFSDATDRLAPFRKMSLFGLLVGFPILLYVIVYGFARTAVGCFAKEKTTVRISSVVCLGIGIALFVPMLGNRPLSVTDEGVNQALASEEWTHRVAALRHIEARKLEITRYPSYRKLKSSSMVVERYWLARALASSHTAATYSLLIHLLNDPHPNVVCQAFFALGERGQRRAIEPIRKKLPLTNHWYAQWYGYRALRRLGWYQAPSR